MSDLPVHGRIKGVPHTDHNRCHEEEQAKNEPRGSTPRFVRGLRDAKGVDEGGSEDFEKLHSFSVRKMMCASGSPLVHRISDLRSSCCGAPAGLN